MLRHPAPSGCFKAAYPKTKWVRIACGKPLARNSAPQGAPVFGTAANMVQAQGSVSAMGGTLTTANGTISDVFGLTAETVTGGSPNAGRSNVYSLQMNTNSFRATQCASSTNASCNGFVQFVFDNNDTSSTQTPTSYVSITYVLNNYGSSCPSTSWAQNGATCYLQTAPTDLPSVVPLSGLSGLALQGGNAGGNDFVTITLTNGLAYTFTNTGSPIGLSAWNQVQFNVFGDKTVFGSAQGANAQFNPGSTMQVTTTLPAQPGLSATCFQNSVTAETANLTGASNCNAAPGANPGIQFVQGTAPINVSVSPASAVSGGGTSLSVSGTGFTNRMIANFNGQTAVPVCDGAGNCTVTAPPGTPGSTIDVQMANVSPATGAVGVYSSPDGADKLTYSPQCTASQACAVYANNPPTFSLSCSASDYYSWSGTPINGTTPPPGGMTLVASNTTTFSTSMTDFNVFIAACQVGQRSPCTSYSIYVPVSGYCHCANPATCGGGGGGGGTVTCQECRETGRACRIVNGRAECVGNIE